MSSHPKKKVHGLLEGKSVPLSDPAGRQVRVIGDPVARAIAEASECALCEVYLAALERGIYPCRYIRNRDIVSPDEQLKLAKSRVAVVGAGGLGGQVILLLARIGIGTLVVLDHDVFDESNLNRQALSTVDCIGASKSEAALRAVASVNPGVTVIPHRIKLEPAGAPKILSGCHVVVDALDNIADRFVLEDAARELGIPLVHGALAGFEGQLMTVFPEDEGLVLLYGSRNPSIDPSASPEAVLGVPAITPAVVAGLEAMEVLKILLDRGRLFRNRFVRVDLEAGRFNEFLFKGEE